MRPRSTTLTSLAALLGAALLAGCTSDAPADGPAAPSASGSAATDGSGDSDFFDQAEYDRQLELAKETPEGPEDKPWEQMLRPEFIDTAEYAKKGGGDAHLCFSNAGVFNPWRQVGLKNMRAEVELHKEIGKFTVLDAQGK
ncbi:ABC transporter substrate-binding protein, partial [Streptomyces albidoflavus]